MKFFCIGNSHVNIFRGIDQVWGNDTIDLFTTKHLGATIAYNFYEHHYPQVLDYLSSTNINMQTDYVMLIVGEVDCRWHLPKQAEIQNINIEHLVEECINRYFRCYLDLINRGYKVIVWGGHPSTTSGHCDNADSPVYGNCEYRNTITLYWNNYLKQLSEKNNIPFLSIIKYLIDDNNLTKMEYFMDYCHLKSSMVMPFVNKELKHILYNLCDAPKT
jgi:hypothetical protein